MKTVRFLLPADHEMVDAAFYYERQSYGLGADFLDKIEAASADIAENPEMSPIVIRKIRRRLIRRFPYALLYRDDPEEIVILAVMHLHRRPDYWMDRF